MAPDMQTLDLNLALLFPDLASTVFSDEVSDDAEYAGSEVLAAPIKRIDDDDDEEDDDEEDEDLDEDLEEEDDDDEDEEDDEDEDYEDDDEDEEDEKREPAVIREPDEDE